MPLFNNKKTTNDAVKNLLDNDPVKMKKTCEEYFNEIKKDPLFPKGQINSKTTIAFEETPEGILCKISLGVYSTKETVDKITVNNLIMFFSNLTEEDITKKVELIKPIFFKSTSSTYYKLTFELPLPILHDLTVNSQARAFKKTSADYLSHKL